MKLNQNIKLPHKKWRWINLKFKDYNILVLKMESSKENLKSILGEIVLASSIHGIPGILRT